MQFLRYSISSNGELKACYYVADGRRYLRPEETAELIELNERVAKMLRRWQGTLEEAGDANQRTKDGPRTQDEPRTN